MNYAINQIIQKRKITDYLSSKGIYPVGSVVHGKYRYKCPIHKGDNTPSFMVYLNGDFENFFCFGCKAKYHIVHLYQKLENVSLKDAVIALSNGLDINIDSELDFILKDLESDSSIHNVFNPLDLSLIISRQIYQYIKYTNNNPNIRNKMEILFQSIDNAVQDCDMKALYKAYEYLPEAINRSIKNIEKEAIKNNTILST